MALFSCDTWLQKINTGKVHCSVLTSFYYLIFFHLSSYDSESRKIQTKAVANMFQGEESGFWKLLYQGANDLTRKGLAFGELMSRRNLWFNETPTG